jgi:integrase
MKLKEWLDTWLNKYAKIKVKHRTFEIYSQIVEKHIVPELGEFELDDLSAIILQDFAIRKLEQENLKTGKPLSTNTVIGITNVLKEALELANDLGLSKTNSASKIQLPQQQEKKITAFDKASEDKIISYCLSSKKNNYLGIVLALCSGVRIGELLALKKEDIDFAKGTMTVSKTTYLAKVNGKYAKVIDCPKTKNSNRVIPLPKQLLTLLKKSFKSNKSEYVISTKNGDMVSTRSYQRTYEKILKRLNIPYMNFHSLRHTFATRALEYGMDAKTLSEILGHKNPMITLTRYAHSLDEHKTSMMNKLGKFLLPNENVERDLY